MATLQEQGRKISGTWAIVNDEIARMAGIINVLFVTTDGRGVRLTFHGTEMKKSGMVINAQAEEGPCCFPTSFKWEENGRGEILVMEYVVG